MKLLVVYRCPYQVGSPDFCSRLSKPRSSANKVKQNFNAFWKFLLSLENSAWDFFWGAGNVSGPGIFLDFVEGFNFYPRSIIPDT